MDVTITPYPPLRALQYSTSGQKDGELCRIYAFGKANSMLLRVPTPYYSEKIVAVVKKGSQITIRNKEDLGKFRVAYIRGVKVSQNLTLEVKDVLVAGKTEQILKMLEIGRIDIGIVNEFDANLQLKKLDFSDKLVVISNPLVTEELYHYIHVKHKDLIARVDSKILEMKENGELKKLVESAESLIISNILHKK